MKVQRWQSMAKWTLFDNRQFYIWEFTEDIGSANRHCSGVFVHLELWDTSCWICQQELCDPGYWLGQSPSTNWTGCESLTLEPATCNSSIGTTLIPPSETPSHHSFGNPWKSRIRIPLGFWAEPRPRWSQAHALPSRSAGCQVIEYQKHEPNVAMWARNSQTLTLFMFIFMFIL